MSVLWFLLYPIYSKWHYKNHFKKHVEENYKNRINKSVEIIFNEGYISAKDFTSESKISGSEIKELIETKKHFFLKLKTDISIIIPKHSINDNHRFKNIINDFGVKYINELNWVWK
ncbi:YcxB family protein [Polaribacter aestuariivivens]|uniref:YcxB family protein n=1 Tax=Polaribacter aestuariivivens TaxID=2304626 RepID=UPI001CA405E1|nr:YcxB family protein [Polaribacter aestuariivivens]